MSPNIQPRAKSAIVPRQRVDPTTRRRIAGHVKGYMVEHRIATNLELAQRAKLHPSIISRVLSGKGPLGLDVFIALHRNLHINANLMLDEDYKPPRVWSP